jgi:hypothetical protein
MTNAQRGTVNEQLASTRDSAKTLPDPKPCVRRLRPVATRPGATSMTSTSHLWLPVIWFFVVFLSTLGVSFGANGILWSAGMETGDLREWNRQQLGGEFNSGNAVSQASRDVAHTGQYSAKLTITTPPQAGVRLFRWGEPRQYPNLYYSVWYYFPRRYDTPAGWWNIFQWKSKTATRNDPFDTLNVGNRANGNMYLYLYRWVARRSYSQTIKDLPVGQWVHVEAFYRCAADGTGRVTVWQDGAQLFDVQNVNTRHAGGDCQWSVTNYSDRLTPSPTTIYIDDAAIGTTRIGAAPLPASTNLTVANE